MRVTQATILVIVFSLSIFISANNAVAQQKTKDYLLGSWMFVSAIAEGPTGEKTELFGPNPNGIMIFSKDGYFSLFQSRSELPKIAANDRSKATPEEAKAILHGAIAYYGTYSLNEPDKTILVKVTASTFPNLAGPNEQKRIITSLTDEELKFTNPRTPTGVTLYTTWKRATSP